MTITKDRKRHQLSDVFPTIEDFIIHLKEIYNNINFDSLEIKNSIHRIYHNLIEDDGNVLYLRLSRWLPKQFRFKHSNKFSLPFWIERGFTENNYKSYTDGIFNERKNNLKLYREKVNSNINEYDENYSNIFKYKTTSFISNERPICNLCNSLLKLIKSNYFDDKIYKIKSCENIDCDSNIIKSKDIKWKSYLPNEEYLKIKKNLKDVNRSFSKEFWINKGFSKEDSIKKVFDIQSSNSKKFKGKRTGKNKELLRLKGYSEEQIKETSLSPSNIKFWLNKGYSEEESIEIISKNNSNASKYVDYEKRLLPSNLEYWIKKGFSQEESLLKVKEKQTTFSKEICIKKFGEEKGIEVFNERTEKWFLSLKNNDKIFIGYSGISQELFKNISSILKREFLYAVSGGEFKIQKDNGGYYFYDFTDISNNKIIEYNGDMYHANPLKYKENDYPHPFRKKLTSKEIWDKDKLKNKKACEHGYDILVIWDSEYRNKSDKNKQEVIQKCINFLTNK